MKPLDSILISAGASRRTSGAHFGILGFIFMVFPCIGSIRESTLGGFSKTAFSRGQKISTRREGSAHRFCTGLVWATERRDMETADG